MADLKLTQEVFEKILERLAQGRSLRSICRDEDVPVSDFAVRQKLSKTPEMYSRYAYARDLGLDAMAEEMLDIAHNSSNDWMTIETERGNVKTVLNHEHVQRSKLRKEALQWYISKLAPKRYGDKIQTDVTSSDGSLKGMSQDQIAHKLNNILVAAQKRMEAAKQATPTEEEDLDALVAELV